MPFLLPERLPLPSLRTYTIISVFLFAIALFHARNLYTPSEKDGKAFAAMFGKESFSSWAILNMAYCCLFLLGKVIQKFVFGNLRMTEEQHLQEKFWNFVFYKVIFVFGVINAQTITDVMCWVAWFSMLGFWHMFGQLCKDRYELLTSSPCTTRRSHLKLICLLVVILLSSVCMAFAANYSKLSVGWNVLGFMLADCLLLGFKCIHIIMKYFIQLIDASQNDLWEGKAKLSYYTDLVIECFIHSIDLIHHLHMLFWSNVFLSMASLVLYWNIRGIFAEMKKKLKKHKRYQQIVKSVQEKFPVVTDDELNQHEDHCAICWDDMKAARKLPCSHMFHQACLSSWLQQDTSCPTCRMPLASSMGLPEHTHTVMPEDGTEPGQFADIDHQVNQRNHFFHFDGTRIANWFPSFSIEVFHGMNQDSVPEHALEEMAMQVHAMFPNVPHDIILEDIRRTQSPEATADNILEGNIFINNLSDDYTEDETVETEMEQRPPISYDEDDNQDDSDLQISEASDINQSESGSDANSLADFDDAEFRQQSLRNRRHDFMTEARRRYVLKSKDVTPPKGTASLHQSATTNSTKIVAIPQEERRIRVLQAIERRMKQDQILEEQPNEDGI